MELCQQFLGVESWDAYNSPEGVTVQGLSPWPLVLRGEGAVGTPERSLGREQPTGEKEAWENSVQNGQ